MQFSGDDDDVGGEDDVEVPSDDFGVERACVTALAALAKASDKDSLGLMPSGNPCSDHGTCRWFICVFMCSSNNHSGPKP